MAVLSVPDFSGVVIVPLTIRSIFLHVRYYISFRNGGQILKQYCIPISNRHQRRWLDNTGVSQSKQSSGNRSENLSANNGSNITTVNYYGAYYAGAKGEASLQMDPEKFTKPIVELANGPALKSPNIEECGYSDRIIQITAGNSTITTQEAAKAIVAYGQWPNDQQYNKGQSVDKDSKPGPSVERFYTLDSIQWTSTFKGRAYRLPGVLTNLGMFGQNCTYHYLLNTGYVVHVQVNATKFHAGMLLVAAIPECQVLTEPSDAMDLQDEFFRQYPLHQLTVFPHQLINLRTNNSATIIIPYINCNPSDSPLAHNNVTIVIAQVAQLNYGTGASTFVPITTTIGPMNTSFSGIRNAVVFQGVPTFNVPGSGQFMTTLKNDGYPAIPFFEQVKDVHIPGRVRNLMEVCQIDTFCNAHSGSPVINIAPGDYNNRPIATWDMSLLSILFETTYLGKFAKFYSQYRGSIKITFIMCGTALTTGKLLISYTPPGGDAPQNRTDAMLGTHMIWDIGLQSSVTFVIPYISATQYRFSNVSNNVLSYCGYISVFMQTAIVTPPSTSQVVPIAIMASACEDMEFRLATDNAYYQGINDDITALVENKIKTILKSTETPAITGPSLPNTLSIQEGDSVALTSAETGASSSTQPGQVMETREIPLTFSKLETSVESFLSRYSVFFEGEININSGGSGFVEVPLWVNQDATTQLAVRTKYRMFTYLKMHFDIIIIITMKEGARANNLIVTSPQPYTFQAIFSPAGAPKPTTWDSAEWDVPTTPSIYFKSTDPPASIRLPFMSPSFAYPIFYDGYSNFETQTNQYGLFPGNNMGSLFLRSLAKYNVTDSVAGKFNVKCFSRPLDIQAWVPRPIVTLKDTVYLNNSRGRVEPVSHNTGNLLHTRTGPFGVDMRVQTGPKKRNSKPYAHIRNNPPPFYKKFPVFTYCSDDSVSFHGIPITKDVIAIPYHLSFDALKLDDKYCDYKVIYSSINFDLTLIKCKHDYEPVKLVPPSGYLWSSCYTKLFQKTLRFSKFKDLPSCWFNENGFVEEHEQFSMIECNLPVKSGWCGSPLYNSEGVIGMSTGTDVHWSTYTVLLEVPAIVGLVTIDEQGLTDCTSSLFSSLGSAFGRSAVESATKAFKENVDVASYTNETVKSIISLLVKAITVTVMIARSDDKIATAVGLGVLLGTDLLIGSPFDWLREKVSNILGLKNAQCQGPIDWLKDFNVVCTSMKWIDWIGEKILGFVEWIKSLLVVDEDKEKFKEDIKLLPDLIQKFDKVIKSPSRVSNVEKEKLCDSIINLKMRADKYGIIRNFATSQLLEKYNKAIQVKSSLNRKRFEPIAVLIHGEPGTGKSLSTIAIGKILSKHLGADEPYSLPPDPKYFDGYEQQPVVIMDDVAQNPDGEDLKLFCQMVSTTTFHVPMADLPDKGKTFISDFVLASTNCNGDLTPPTVREPLAIKRRFYLDLDIEIKDEYKVNGRLDANKALQFDGKKCANFKNSCPLFNGAAVVFKDRRTNMRYNMDNLVTKLLQEHDNRNKCLSQLDKVLAFEQGAVCPEFTFKCDKIEPKPCPKEVIDLIRAVPDERIIQYCAKQGWLLEPEDNVTILREEINTNLRDAAFILSILASLAGLAMFVYFVFKNAYQQGAYSDCIQNKQPKPPIKRMVVPQGATEFELSLLRKSLFQVKTEKGEFTGVGLYEKFMILPTHACPTSCVEFESKKYNVLEIFNLSNDKGPLEISIVKLDRPVNFRDIRNYLPEYFSSVKCNLVVNSALFPNYLVDVGRVSSFGYLNLSYKNVYNTCTYMFPTRIGQCGGLLVTQDHKIVAMHIGGDGANGYGAILTRKMFAEIQGHITSVEKTDQPVNISTKTAFRPSVFYDVFPGEKEPAVLHPKDPRLSRYVDFDKDLFSKYLNMKVEKMDIPVTENMHVAIKHYASRIKTLLPPDYRDPMGLTEVIYGVPGLDGIDLTTSAGFPYVQQGIKKRDLIPEKGQPLNRLTEALDLHGYDLPFITYLKDELRPKEKIEFGKTRLIECSSLNDTIRMKRKFGNLFKTYHLNPGIVTGSAVGCDPDIHWSLFYTQFGGEPLIAFDYKNFDGSLHKVWFKCLILFLQELGFDNVDEIRHIMNSVHIYKNIEYKVEGGMPSGTSGTSIFNSIINNIIIRTLVLDVYKGIDLDFLKILCYGDDLIVTYPFQLDASLIAEKGLDYGLHMTPPDKSKEFNEITWSDVTFLKRKFVPDKEFPFLIHPVYDINNVFESARWCKSASNTQEHILSLCQLAWHSGKEVYNQFLDKITSVPVGRALYLPSYEVLRKNWLDKF